MAELQSLTLVNGQDAHAMCTVALNGLAADGLVPLADKGVNVRRVVLCKLVQLVVEGAEIRALVVQKTQLEDVAQPFHQLVERQLQQFGSMLDEGLGQEIVQGKALEEDVGVGNIPSEDGTLVELGNGSLGQQVVRVGKQVQGLHQQGDGSRGIQTERLVADDGNVGEMECEVLGNDGDIPVGTHQNGDVGERSALLLQSADGIGNELERLLLIVVVGQQVHADVSHGLGSCAPLLGDVGIGMAQLLGSGRILFKLLLVFLSGCFGEEGVVEGNDVPLRAVVGAQRLHLHARLGMAELLVDGVEQSPVAGTPAVDALLDIADNEVLGVAVAHALFEQHLEVLPLHGARVLELVNHDMLQLRADLLEDKRRVAVADEGVEQLLGVAEQEAVGLVVELADLLLDATQQS